MITKDLGAVTAYAYAVEKGYTGTEAEYAELMASYASVAEQASQSAQTATEKAQQASESAQGAAQAALNANTAMNYAKTAESYAHGAASEAQGYAQSAQQGATTATTKAQEASQSASTASQSAQTAVQAKQDAQTAQTASETAQASAESARDDAESARDTAQQYAESIDPQKLIGAYPVDTATGAIASFTDGADDIPMKSVKVKIEPKQAGSGDPSPDNVRPISGWDSVQVSHSGADMTNPTTKTISLPQTVYGGTLDVATGELVVDRAIVDLGQYNWVVNNHATLGTYFFASIPISMIKYRGEFSAVAYPILTPLYKASRRTPTLFLNNCICFDGKDNDKQVTQIQIKDDRYSNADEFKTAIQGVMLCYELATPITLTLTPTEIKSLLGDNNVWGDTEDTEVVYRADTTLYINRKIAEAVSALS